MQQTTLTDNTFYALSRSRRRSEGLIFNNKYCYSEACSRMQLNYGEGVFEICPFRSDQEHRLVRAFTACTNKVGDIE